MAVRLLQGTKNSNLRLPAAMGTAASILPWARFPDNGLANLVVADVHCNRQKSDRLAGPEFLRRGATALRPRST